MGVLFKTREAIKNLAQSKNLHDDLKLIEAFFCNQDTHIGNPVALQCFENYMLVKRLIAAYFEKGLSEALKEKPEVAIDVVNEIVERALSAISYLDAGSIEFIPFILTADLN